MEQRFHVFVSFSSADRVAVEAIVNGLRDAWLDPWFDRWYLTAEAPWQDELAVAMGCTPIG